MERLIIGTTAPVLFHPSRRGSFDYCTHIVTLLFVKKKYSTAQWSLWWIGTFVIYPANWGVCFGLINHSQKLQKQFAPHKRKLHLFSCNITHTCSRVRSLFAKYRTPVCVCQSRCRRLLPLLRHSSIVYAQNWLDINKLTHVTARNWANLKIDHTHTRLQLGFIIGGSFGHRRRRRAGTGAYSGIPKFRLHMINNKRTCAARPIKLALILANQL